MYARSKTYYSIPPRGEKPTITEVAKAYNAAGEKYLAYADGDPEQLYAFDGRYSYGDRQIWSLIDAKLVARRNAGAISLRVLDMGCGPGTWLRRVVIRARALGYTDIFVRGFDISDEQVHSARRLAARLNALPGVNMSFDVADIRKTLPERDASVDLSLCLYGVFNHLPPQALPAILAELARVTAGSFITTVRAAGSLPTIYVDAVEQARHFQQDNRTNRLEVDMNDGRHLSLSSHLYTAAEMRRFVAPRLRLEKLVGLDLFHNRFAPDARWNPELPGSAKRFATALTKLESAYAHDPNFIDRATHILIVAGPKTSAASATIPDRRRRRVRRAA